MTSSTMSDTFIEHVKNALEHLYDYPALQTHILGRQFGLEQHKNPGQALRRLLLDALESLNPGTDVYFRSPYARLYNLLHLHYVEGMTISETASELGISERQAYRDLRKGQERIAEILWLGLQQPSQSPPPPLSVNDEFDRLDGQLQLADVAALLKTSLRSVERLAEAHHVTFALELPPEPIWLSLIKPVAQQMLTNLLSLAVQNTEGDELFIRLHSSIEGAHVHIKYDSDHTPVSSVVQQLSDRLGWTIEEIAGDNHQHELKILVKTSKAKVLVIDDNEGLIDLIDRFLTDQSCEVIGAQNAQAGFNVLDRMTPDAIILDVMMPEIDGWEMLQRLRAIPQTETIPIIICTVFNDPELAYSLGATAFMPKPIQQQTIIDTLQQVGIF